MKAIYDKETSAPLYLKYAGQCVPQNAHVTVYAGSDEAEYEADTSIGNGSINMDVFNGKAVRYSVPNVLNEKGIERLHEEIAPLLKRVAEGVELDSYNEKGKLNEDATEANEELESFLERGYWEYDMEFETDCDFLTIVEDDVDYNFEVDFKDGKLTLEMSSQNLYEGKEYKKEFSDIKEEDFSEGGRVFKFLQEDVEGLADSDYKAEEILDEIGL